MKLLLTSEGIRNKQIAEELENLVAKPRKETSFLLITTASNTQKYSKAWLFLHIDNLRKHFSDNIDMMDMSAFTREEILERMDLVDVVYFSGGATDFLMKVIREKGIEDDIKTMVGSGKVFVGNSAGSMIFGHRRPNAADKLLRPEDSNVKPVLSDSDDYMGLVDFAIIAHTGQVNELFTRSYASVAAASEIIDWPVYALDDESAVVVNGDHVFVASKGDNWEYFLNE